MNMNENIVSIGEILFDVYPAYKKLGGAPFNFIHHIWKLTGNGKFISRIGNDSNGKEILSFLTAINFDASYIQTDDEHPTGTVNVKLRDDKTPDFIINKNTAYDFIEKNKSTDELINSANIFYFGTLAQRNEKTRETIQSYFERETKYFCDINIRQDFYSAELIKSCLKNSNVVKINSDELNIINYLLLNDNYDLDKSSEKLMREYNIDLLCVTMGEDGSLLLNQNERSKYCVKANSIVDTVGAGDAYAAVLCIGYLRNWSLEDINKIASEFAADICGIEGAVPKNDNFYDKYRNAINNGS